MKNLLLIPVLCVMCFACNSDNKNNGTPTSSQETSADWEITTKVKSKIVADTQLSASSRLVSVTTNNGIVTLSGGVASTQDRDRIASIARSVDGVKGVDMQITVSE